jgi:hypothetical protein
MDANFVKLTAAGFVVLTAASAIKQKRAAKKTAPSTLTYDFAPIMEELIVIG